MTPCLPCSSDRSVSSGQARAARSGSLASSRSSPRRLGGSLCHWRVLIRGLRPRRRVMSSHAIVAVANSTSAAPATLNHPLALRPEPNAACSPDRGSISAFPTRETSPNEPHQHGLTWRGASWPGVPPGVWRVLWIPR
jgi:hypothetical protein